MGGKTVEHHHASVLEGGEAAVKQGWRARGCEGSMVLVPGRSGVEEGSGLPGSHEDQVATQSLRAAGSSVPWFIGFMYFVTCFTCV